MREFAKQVFAGALPGYEPCDDCGGIHRRTCPRVASIRWTQNDDGMIMERNVTYWPNGQWEDGIIFPEDVYESDDAPGSDGDAAESAGTAAAGTELAAYSGSPAAELAAGGEETG